MPAKRKSTKVSSPRAADTALLGLSEALKNFAAETKNLSPSAIADECEALIAACENLECVLAGGTSQAGK